MERREALFAMLMMSFAARKSTPGRLPTIQLFGDSTNDSEIGAYSYWVSRFGSRVINRAVGGTNSRELIAGTDGLNLPWPQSVSADVIVINHGLRDGYVGQPAAFTTITEYKNNYRAFASQVPASTTVIFETPNPSTIPARDMAPYAAAMIEVAAEFPGVLVIDVYSGFQNQANWQSRVPDGTHPDATGLAYIVNTICAPIIEALPLRR